MKSLSGPRAIEAENLRKYFRIPDATSRGTLNRLMHPVQRGRRRTLRVLDGITFDVQRGELFGIVGRNGSGKSTLLRVLASIYRADAGRVRINGRVGPFLELGVGFQPQMSARQNVALNGVMLGLGRREVQRRVDEVLAYAELEEFRDVQLKNFSSGMRARLAFASTLQADPDIYLMDEVFAAGDEAFRTKCDEEFDALKLRGKTIVLVTHRPGIIEQRADRAMLLKDGRIPAIGGPGDVLEAYRGEPSAETAARTPEEPARKRRSGVQSSARKGAQRTWATVGTLVVQGSEGSDEPRIAAGEPLGVWIEAEASGWVHGPTLELAISDEDGTTIFVGRDSDRDRLPVLKPGDRLTAEITFENPLTPGRYRLECALLQDAENRSGAVSPVRSLDFAVDGDPREGLVALERTVALNPSSRLALVR